MHSHSIHTLKRVALLAGLLISAFSPTTQSLTQAQAPAPTTTGKPTSSGPDTSASASTATSTGAYHVIPLDSPSRPAEAPPASPGSHSPSPLVLPPSALAAQSALTPASIRTQGSITLAVSTPDTVHAGDLLTYTFRYRNTGVDANNVVIDANFSNATGFSPMQSCQETNCTPTTAAGPAVGLGVPPPSADRRYLIGTLLSGQYGAFSIVLRINAHNFPVSGQPVQLPAASGRLYASGDYVNVISNDTANSLIVGPVFALSKTASNCDSQTPLDGHTHTGLH